MQKSSPHTVTEFWSKKLPFGKSVQTLWARILNAIIESRAWSSQRFINTVEGGTRGLPGRILGLGQEQV